MLRVAGIVALIVLATACGQSPVKTVASPSPVIPQGNWTQGLTLTGDLSGQMTGIVPDIPNQQSQCTGSKTRVGERWADSFYGTIDAAGQVWGIVFSIDNFGGPGTYLDKAITVEMHSVDVSKVWQSRDGDKVTFTIDRSQQSGTVDASLTSATTGKANAEHITGRWNCRG
jgi:hypothetical protein